MGDVAVIDEFMNGDACPLSIADVCCQSMLCLTIFVEMKASSRGDVFCQWMLRLPVVDVEDVK